MVFWDTVKKVAPAAAALYTVKKAHDVAKEYSTPYDFRSDSSSNTPDISRQKEIQKEKRTKIRKAAIYKLLLDYRKIELLEIAKKDLTLVGEISIEIQNDKKLSVVFSSLDNTISNFQKAQKILLGSTTNNQQKINSQYEMEFQIPKKLIDDIEKKATLDYGELSGIDIYVDYVDYVEELDSFMKILEKESMRIKDKGDGRY